MALLSDYTAGTITVSANGTAVTGVGTAWATAAFKEGDWFIANGWVNIVASINSETSLTLAQPWRGGALSSAAYRLRYMSDGSRTSAQARKLIDMLGGSGNLEALGGLVGVAGKVPVFTGPGTMTLTDPGTPDPNGNLGALAALISAANTLPYFTNAGTAELTALTAFARTLLDDGDANAALTTLGATETGRALISAANEAAARTAVGATAFGSSLITAASQAAGRTALGVNATAAVTGAADRLAYFTSASAAAVTPLTALARSLLDDTTGAQMYATMGAEGNFNATGYRKRPDGLIEQWGPLSGSGGDYTITFPLVFPNAVRKFQCQAMYPPLSAAELISWVYTALNTSGATVRPRYATSGGTVGISTGATGTWSAVGY